MQPALHQPRPSRLLAPMVREWPPLKAGCTQAERPTFQISRARSRPGTQKAVRWLSTSGRKLRRRRPVSHSHTGHTMSSNVACRLTEGIVEVTVTQVEDTVGAGVSHASQDREAREKEARQKERKAARWRTQPSSAPLDSQESCIVS